MMQRVTLCAVVCLTGAFGLLIFAGHRAHAATVPNGDFSLEVSPSPLVVDVRPGEKRTIELKIRNASTQPENLTIETRGFSIARPSEQINITQNTPPDLAQWIHYSHPTFSVAAGQWFTQEISIELPDSVGFSYPFVVVINRQAKPTQPNGGAAIRASIAVFTLVNIDKPGATRKLEIESFNLDRNFYEYLPTTFNLTLKNTGNSIVQPYGNLYIQTPGSESEPLAVFPVNQSAAYILPGSTKKITTSWADGFPVYTATKDKDGKEHKELQWDWENIAHFRFGHYTAKVVAVYNDGTRDIPVVSEVGFWVIPWRIMLGMLVVVIIIGFGLWSIIRRITRQAGKLVNNRKKQ